MTDLALSVAVTRTQLGLSELNLNDHVNYYVAQQQFMGGTMTWTKNQITSPYVDGATTVNRTRGQVTEPVTIEVLGTSDTVLQTNMATLINAFSQDSYDLLIAIGAANYQYQCEAADVQQARWTVSGLLFKQQQIVFQVPRQPVPILGGV